MRIDASSCLRFPILTLAIALAGCGPRVEPAPSATSPTAAAAQVADREDPLQDPIHRGQYLIRIGGCNDCHTPWVFDPELGMPKPDMSRMLAGHPADGPDPEGTRGPHDIGLIGPTFTSFTLPFGTIYSQNLTPDVDTGIGSWTEEMFVDALRNGRHMGGDGRGILPPMPWIWFRNLTDEDLHAVYAYLQSIPPIVNPVPSPKVADEVIWQLRDSMDRFAAELPHEEWVPTMETTEGPAEASD